MHGIFASQLLLPSPRATPSLASHAAQNGCRHAHPKGTWQAQAVSNVADTQRRASNGADGSVVESTGGNLEGRKERDQKVVLRGGGDMGQPLQGQDAALEENKQWQATAFPSYLQSAKDDFCQNWDEAIQDVERQQSSQNGSTRPNAVTSSNPVWQAMRKEARKDAANEPLLSSFMYASILSHSSFLECLAFVLANRLSDPTMLATEYFETFLSVFNENAKIVQAALDDIQAVRERDPACGSYSNALLFYKGYQAIQVHRIAHHLWNLDQRISARNLQSRVSQVFSMDIHPQAQFGRGILMDHGTGIVIGQTAVVGNNVSILQNVTLGGTGKSDGDRHPKINDNVLIGAGATILGNISVGKGAMVASGSLVLKHVPPKTMVAGSPAKEVGKIAGNPALKMQHWLKTINPESDPFCDSFEGMLQTRSRESADAAKTNAQPTEASGSQTEEPQSLEESSSDESDDEQPVSPNFAEAGPADRIREEKLSSTSETTASAMDQSSANGSQPALSEASGAESSHESSLRQPENLQQSQNGAGPPAEAETSQDSDQTMPAQQQKDKPSKEQREHAVVGVRSDSKAHKLWPKGPEPEYYL